MSTLLSMLGLTTRRDAEELAAVIDAWRGAWDIERTRSGGLVAYCLVETREPVTARTPAALGVAMAAARSAGRVRRPARTNPW